MYVCVAFVLTLLKDYCCLNLKKYADCIQWCEMGLSVDPQDQKLRDMRAKAEIERVSIKLSICFFTPNQFFS